MTKETETRYLKSMTDVVTEFFLAFDALSSNDERLSKVLCIAEKLSMELENVLDMSSSEIHEELEEEGIDPYKVLSGLKNLD